MKKIGKVIAWTLMGGAVGTTVSMWLQQKVVRHKNKKIDKFIGYYQLLDEWLNLKQKGKGLSVYFVDNGYHKIAIYGLGKMGERLIDELAKSEIEIAYGIDKEIFYGASRFPVYSLTELQEMEPVDAVIVTAIFAFDEIVEQLSGVMKCPIVNLKDVVYEAEL